MESVIIQSLTAEKSVNIGRKIDCPTEYITLKGKEKTLKKQVADQIYECWNKMGRNELQLYDDTKDKFCFVCSVIDFKDKEMTLTDFITYEAENKPYGEDQSYFYLFTGREGKDVIDPSEIGTVDDLDTSKKYAVVYTFLTKDYINQMQTAGISAGVAGGVVTTIGLALIISGVGLPLGLVVTAGGAAAGGGGLLGYVLAKDADWTSYVGLIEYTPTILDGIDCTEVPSAVSSRG
ncbi:MAG: hypothetical protein Q8O89_05120 [Nanoarchaeota archaeon]|nr:hypothetical protein [Nanoarchaeota archaeon]